MKELEAELAMVRPLPSQPCPLQVPAVLGDRALPWVHPRILKLSQAAHHGGGAGLGAGFVMIGIIFTPLSAMAWALGCWETIHSSAFPRLL